MQKNCGQTFQSVLKLKVESYLIMLTTVKALSNFPNSETSFFLNEELFVFFHLALLVTGFYYSPKKGHFSIFRYKLSVES